MTYDSVVLADSPVGYWKLADTSGSTAVDSSGNGHDLTYTGSPTLAASGIVPNDAATGETAVSLSGTGQYASVAAAAWQDGTRYSFEAWIRCTDFSSNPRIAAQFSGTGTGRRFQFYVGSTGKLNAAFGIGTSFNTVSTSGTVIAVNTNYHVACVYDGTNMILYLNGSQVANAGQTGSLNTTTVTDPFYVGNGIVAFPGKIEKAALWTSAISAARILAHYNAGLSTSVDALGSLGVQGATVTSVIGGTTLGAEGAASVAVNAAGSLGIQGFADSVSGAGSLGFEGSAIPGVIGSASLGVEGSAVPRVAGLGSLGVDGSVNLPAVASGSLGFQGSTAFIPVTFPAPAAPSLPGSFTPATALHAAVQRASRVYSAPTLDSRGLPVSWDYASTTEAAWGWRRIVIGGVDRTYTGADNGMPTITVDYELAEPFGCGPGTLTARITSPYQAVPSWLVAGKAVDVIRLYPDGTTTDVKWSGEIAASGAQVDERARKVTCELVGDLWAGDTQTHKPPLYRPETDCGTVIADELNAVVNRRIGSVTRVVTGITTSARGAATDTPVSFCQQILATMTTDDGTSQWTVARDTAARTYKIRLKDRTTVNWTVRFGQPGAQVSLTRDPRTAPNRIYASGVSPDGYAWANWKYPFNRADAAPGYPFVNPATTIGIGTTDGTTDSGTGVSDWQTQVNNLGIPGAKVTVDGSYSSQDAGACRIVQKAFGITVDGIIGGQTWAATFNVGANGANLDGAFRMPLAWDSTVLPRLLNADGSDAGANSGWNSSALVVDRDEDMGAGITKAQAVRSAQAELTRNGSPGLVGEIILTGDPQEGSRLDIREGQNIKVLGFQGADVLLHIAQVRVSGVTVRLTVDERGLDLITLAGILSRDAAAATDPARMPARKYRRSVLARDAIVDFDSESPGGIVPDFALFGGLWSVIHIPVSQQGSVASVTLTTHGPAAPFVVAFFGDSVTANFMVANVGNPLADRTDGYLPFDWARDTLLTAGFIEAIGGPGQAAGYGYGYQTSPSTGAATVLTGQLRSTAGFQFRSVRPPWLWLAFYSPSSTRINGRLLPAPAML